MEYLNYKNLKKAYDQMKQIFNPEDFEKMTKEDFIVLFKTRKDN